MDYYIKERIGIIDLLKRDYGQSKLRIKCIGWEEKERIYIRSYNFMKIILCGTEKNFSSLHSSINYINVLPVFFVIFGPQYDEEYLFGPVFLTEVSSKSRKKQLHVRSYTLFMIIIIQSCSTFSPPSDIFEQLSTRCGLTIIVFLNQTYNQSYFQHTERKSYSQGSTVFFPLLLYSIQQYSSFFLIRVSRFSIPHSMKASFLILIAV